jgi:hypothetical protein
MFEVANPSLESQMTVPRVGGPDGGTCGGCLGCSGNAAVRSLALVMLLSNDLKGRTKSIRVEVYTGHAGPGRVEGACR